MKTEKEIKEEERRKFKGERKRLWRIIWTQWICLIVLALLLLAVTRIGEQPNDEIPFEPHYTDINVVFEVTYNNTTGDIVILRPDAVSVDVNIKVLANNNSLGSAWYARGWRTTFHNHVSEPVNFTIVILNPSNHLTYELVNNSENYNFELRKYGY